MTAAILDGKTLAAKIRAGVAQGVGDLVAWGGPVPGLTAVLIGDDPASQTYVRAKRKACAEAGIRSFEHALPEDVSQEEVFELLAELGEDPEVHGILVQLPLPAHMDEEAVLSQVALEKDVDGFHPLNIGRLAQKGREPLFLPATPSGILYLLREGGVQMRGARAVVVGRSNIVGMPTALLLIREDATVTVCHSRTNDLAATVRTADIVVAAIGRAEMIRGDWIQPGAVVIDVGINRIEAPERPRGYRLVGDVAFEEAREVAGALTPVPGGVGPMTIAMLLLNTLRATQRAAGRPVWTDVQAD